MRPMTQRDVATVRHFQLDCTHPATHTRVMRGGEYWCELCGAIAAPLPAGADRQWQTTNVTLWTPSSEMYDPPLPKVREGEIVQNRGSGEAYICVGHGLRGDPIVVKMISMTNADEWATVVPLHRRQR